MSVRVSIDDVDYDDYQRVLLDDVPVTGIVFEALPDGTVLHETEYTNGIQNGLDRTYRPDGSLELQRSYQTGVITEAREWHPNGQLARVARFDAGEKIEESRWDDEGHVA